MYVDSGADISMVSLSIGKALGFNQENAEIKELYGIGGEMVPYIVQKVFFNFNNYKFKARIGWALIEEVPFILGRLDIFPRFKIIFDESNQTIDFITKK